MQQRFRLGRNVVQPRQQAQGLEGLRGGGELRLKCLLWARFAVFFVCTRHICGQVSPNLVRYRHEIPVPVLEAF
jgi:hypothetical protein